MNFELFDEIFNQEILPFANEIRSNNPKIKMHNLDICKKKLYNEYINLNKKYKNQIFEPDSDVVLLDRHKVAACICGAFLKEPVFDKTELIEYIKKERQKLEVYFYYVNELIAVFAASKFLSFFMVYDMNAAGEDTKTQEILKDFPKAPPTTKNKRGFWNSVLFNLSQIKDEKQIGLEHYDMYSYAMFFFWLESYFNR